MLINPLQSNYTENIVSEDTQIYETNKEKVVNNIIDYLLDKHSSVLSNIDSEKNKKIMENIIKERVVTTYSDKNININKVVKDVMDRFFRLLYFTAIY